jgi:ABC-2 type transport system permease protein
LVALSVFGARRVRRAITIVNAVMAAVVCLTIATQTGRMQLHTGIRGGLEMAARLPNRTVHRGPSAPFAAALVHIGKGGPGAGVREIAAVALLVTALYGICVLWGGRVLTAANLSLESEGEGSAVALAGEVRTFRRGIFTFAPGPVAAIVAKDLRYVLRDSVLLSQLGMPSILFFVPVILSLQQASDQSFHSLGDAYPFAAAMTGVIVFMQTSIISLSSLGIEGRAFWQTLASPNSGGRLLWAKFLLSTLISASIGAGLILLSALFFKAPLSSALVHAAIAGLCSAGLCGIGVGVSAAFPRFAYDNPAHRVSTWALILGFLGSIVYLIVAGVLLLTVWTGMNIPEARHLRTAAGAMFVIVTFACIAIPLAIGARRIDVYQWEH